jgi:hypothetical protein
MSEDATVSLFGLTLPIPRWAMTGFGVIAVCGVAAGAYQQLKPSADLVTLKQANTQLQAEVTEYGLHMSDTPTNAYVDSDGLFAIRTFADKCVVIQRKIAGRVMTKLVLDLDRVSHLQTDARPPTVWRSLVQVIEPTLAAQGRCVSGNHAGQFTTRYGTRDGCRVQVWRTFGDGCRHYQMFDSCSGYWDTNPDGSPKVSWTKCVH